jgi:hypothetical protein
MRSIQNFTFLPMILDIFCCEAWFIIKYQSRYIIFFDRWNLFNFPVPTKVLGLGRSIFLQNVSHLASCGKVKTPIRQDIRLVSLHFGFESNTN